MDYNYLVNHKGNLEIHYFYEKAQPKDVNTINFSDDTISSGQI